MQTKHIALVLSFALPVAAVVACGGSDTEVTGATPAPSATTNGDDASSPVGTDASTPPPADAGSKPTDSGAPETGTSNLDASFDAAVDAAPPTFKVKGTVVNAVNAGLVIQNNGGDDVTIAAGATTFEFPVKVAQGAAYAVTVKTRPDQQACSVTAASGNMGNADVTNVVVDCSNRAACKNLHTEFATLPTGTYLVDPDGAGAVAPLPVYCDMDFDDGTGKGGFTLILSTANKDGAAGTAEGNVAPGSSAHLPLATMQAFATLAKQVHVRSTGLAATESITSVADMEPIANLRLGKVSNDGMQGFTRADQVARWTGPFAVEDRLWFDCMGVAAWPDIYWACDNQIGLHLVGPHSRWNWMGGDTTQNQDMEVYLR